MFHVLARCGKPKPQSQRVAMNRKAIPALILFAHIAHFSLFACALPALAGSPTPQGSHQGLSHVAPLVGPDIQTYRLDRLEQSVDKLNQRLDALPEHLENRFTQNLTRQTEATARWVESARDSLSKVQSNFNIFITIFAVVIALCGLLTAWNLKKKYQDFERELTEKKLEIESIVKSCHALHDVVTDCAERTKEISSEIFPNLPHSQKQDDSIKTEDKDESASLFSRLKAIAKLATDNKDWAKAIDYWKAAIHEDFEDPAAHAQLAYCAQHLAKNEPEQASSLLETACSHNKQATEIEPNYALAFYNWGNALANLDKIAETSGDRTRLLKLACEKWEQATGINPNLADAFHNWGAVLIHLAQISGSPEEKTRLLGRAKEVCLKAHDIKPGKGTYNLACIAALEGDKEQCREWLETSLATGNMASCDELTTDEDLKTVRDEPWFKDVLAKVCDR